MNSPRETLLTTKVVHYSRGNPDAVIGGVEAFAKNLRLIFEDVEFMYKGHVDHEKILDENRMVVCDNHRALDLPKALPLVAFQHGVAVVKAKRLGKLWGSTARRQRKAARRPRTLWVSCAQYISDIFENMHGNKAAHIIYHQVDTARFDGVRTPQSPPLVLHDARSEHKGMKLLPVLQSRFPEIRFEPLACAHEEVPARMREATAFVHLSRYEGNSIVCNEAMAMDLPCFFTRVGLMKDRNCPTSVCIVDDRRAFDDTEYLTNEFRAFWSRVVNEGARAFSPREWVLQNASIEEARRRWARVVADWQKMKAAC